ncbi:hypothetical protein NM22_06465 [Vibrio tubiashii]|nr:hypothetical protein NM22_06465 [Vibrio tubiashii]
MPWVVCASVFLNVLFIAYLVVQTNAISRLESIALEQAPISVEMTQKLTDIERAIGYVGFIHHFKNYIIRRDERYYQQALARYDDAVRKVTEFETLTDNSELIAKLEIIKRTLDEYRDNLLIAKSQPAEMSVEALDRIVRVDDEPANQALHAIQDSLLPKFENIHNQITIELKNLSQHTLLLNLFIVPIIIIVGFFVVSVLRKVHKLSCQLATILDMSPDGILYLSEQGEILQANKKACALLEYSESELKKLPLERLVSPKYRDLCSHYREHVFKGDKLYAECKPRRVKALTQSQRQVELEVAIASQRVGDDNRSVCILRDMTHHNELKLKAEKDSLTQLLNRWMLDELLQKELDRCNRNEQPLSLLLVDIDNFKGVNDSLGHDMGDNILRQTANFLRQSTRSYDHISRWGGDEFILVCPNLSTKDAESYADRLLKQYRRLKEISPHNISLSIGIATMCSQAINQQTLFKKADVALYHAKNSGKNRFAHSNTLADQTLQQTRYTQA